MDEELELDAQDKTVIIAVAVFILLVVAAATACFVVPSCCGYRCLQSRRRKNSTSDKITMLEMPKKKLSLKLNEKLSPLYQSGSHLQVTEPQENNSAVPQSLFNGYYRPMSFLPSDVPKPPPTVKIKLTYYAEKDVTSLGRLLVEITEAENVPTREYPMLPDTAIKLEIIHRRWTLTRLEQVVHEVQTRVVRSASSPTFEQNFTFAATVADIKVWCLKIAIFDDDRQTRHRETCCSRLNLRDLKGLTEGQPCPVTVSLEPVLADHGQLLVALSYLPTSQRLSVNIVKASKVIWHNDPSDKLKQPCVRITLLDHSGRVMKKKKIPGNNGLEAPSFNGSACFQIAPMVYETATLLIVVTSEEKDRKQGEEEARKKDALGFIALGWMVHEDIGRNHWRAVLQSPRKVISQWHTLR